MRTKITIVDRSRVPSKCLHRAPSQLAATQRALQELAVMCMERRDDRTVKRAARLQRAANKRGLYLCADALALCAEYVWYAHMRGDELARRQSHETRWFRFGESLSDCMRGLRGEIRRGGLVTLEPITTTLAATGTDDDIPF